MARVRVPLGFVCGVAALCLAHPTWASLAAGVWLAAAGEAIRVWAAGHLEKGREVTTSGPYRFTGHPLYLGSTLIGVGVAVASHSVDRRGHRRALPRARRSARRFAARRRGCGRSSAREYVEYRAGRGRATRAGGSAWRGRVRNREHRAVAGLAAVMILLALKAWLRL